MSFVTKNSLQRFFTGLKNVFAAKNHTHNYAGSSSAGGAANSANFLGKNTTFNKTGQAGIQYYDAEIKSATAVNTDGWGSPTEAWYQIIHMPLSVGNYYNDIAIPVNDVNGIAYRQRRSGNYYGWYRIIDSNNWKNYITKSALGIGSVNNTADADKSVKYATTAGTANAVAWANVSGKPTTFTPSSHNHDDRYYTETEMNTKLDAKANANHTHNYAGSSSAGGSANSALKLATARTVSGGTDITLNYSYDGSANSSASIGYYSCASTAGNTNNYPYHRIAYTGVITSSYADKSMTLYMSQGYQGGGFGIVRITVRTNNSSNVSTAEARWLVRSGFAADAIQIGLYNVYGKTYADVFFKSAGSYSGCVFRAIASDARGGISRTFTLVNSSEVDSTTTSDKKTSKEVYASIASAANALHSNQAYTNTIVAVDNATVSYANSAGSANAVAWDKVTGKPSTFTPSSHTHDAFGKATASSAGTVGFVPAPAKGQQGLYLRGDGTWATPTNTTYSNMTAATSTAAGKAGLVPAPAAGKQGQYLRGDGVWATPTNTTYGAATQSAAGLMSAADKKKLDGVATGANKITVDSALSSTSTNPVQNKVVNESILWLYCGTYKVDKWVQSSTGYEQTVTVEPRTGGIAMSADMDLSAPMTEKTTDFVTNKTLQKALTIINLGACTPSAGKVRIFVAAKPSCDIPVYWYARMGRT